MSTHSLFVSVFALALMIVAGLLSSVVPQVITETRQLALRIPGYADSLEKRLEKWINNPWVQKFFERETKPGSTPSSLGATNELPLPSPTNVTRLWKPFIIHEYFAASFRGSNPPAK